MSQRLILCLDGTWNNLDDSTNVLHHFNLVTEGPAPGGWIQKKEYQAGVGTGPLDSITGGGFGFGLEIHVRDGYNWLVENYQENDEIYVFGFSRGAFTARSLVGFIAMCGLLRRGAPITVSQLWEGYTELARERDERPPLSAKANADRFRRITELVKDPWLAVGDPLGPDGIQGQMELPVNDAEHLLVRWSRRVRITYLGVYDTVGALGWDALAIPVLKSHLALSHNVRPTTIIQKCRHALAINENRSSFDHTAFVAYEGHADEAEELRRMSYRGAVTWSDLIEQRWFVGAHSNIGGGYANNRLAVRPFAWMFEGADRAGLVRQISAPMVPIQAQLPAPVDSFANFAKPLWAMILRAKRNYRRMDPPPEPRASISQPAGFTLRSINEQVDDSVVDYFNTTPLPLPPNLHAWIHRNAAWAVAHNLKPWWNEEPKHTWFGSDWLEPYFLTLWASLAGVGFVGLWQFIYRAETLPWPALMGAVVIAFLAPLVDWLESFANFRLSLRGEAPGLRALTDGIYWTRAFLVVLSFMGAIHFVEYFWTLGWNSTNVVKAILSEAQEPHWWIPVAALIVPVFAMRRS